MAETENVCQVQNCTNIAATFVFSGSSKKKLCELHTSKQAFPIKAFEFLDRPDDYEVFALREKQTNQAFLHISTIRREITVKQDSALADLKAFHRRTQQIVTDIFTAEERRTKQFFAQLEAQLRLLSKELSAYLSKKNSSLSALANAFVMARKAQVPFYWWNTVCECEMEIVQLISESVRRPDITVDLLLLAGVDEDYLRTQFADIKRVAQTSLDSNKYAGMQSSLIQLQNSVNRFEDDESMRLCDLLKKSLSDIAATRREKTNAFLSADCPSANSQFLRYFETIKKKEVDRRNVLRLSEEMSEFVDELSQSQLAARYFCVRADIETENIPKSESFLQSALKIQEKYFLDTLENAETLAKLAILYHKADETTKEKEYCKAALRIHKLLQFECSLTARLFYLLGKINEDDDITEAALSDFNSALAIQKRIDPVTLDILRTYKRIALQHERLKNYPDEESTLQAALKVAQEHFPRERLSARLYHIYSVLQYRSRNLPKARESEEAALAILINESDSLLKIQVMQHLGAIVSSNEVSEPAAIMLLEVFELKQRMFPSSKDFLQILYNAGSVYLQMNKFEEAKIVFKRALSHKSGDANSIFIALIYNSLGLMYNASEQHKDAIFCYKRCCQQLEESHSLNFLKSLALMNTGVSNAELTEYLAAEQAYISALEFLEAYYPQEVTLAQVKNNLAALYMDTNRHAQAVDLLETAIRFLGEFNQKFAVYAAMLSFNAGQCYYCLDEYQRAEEHLLRAISLQADINPQDRNAFVYFEYPKSKDNSSELMMQNGLLIVQNVRGDANEYMGHVYSETNRKEIAERHYGEALRIYLEQGRTEKVNSVMDLMEAVQ